MSRQFKGPSRRGTASHGTRNGLLLAALIVLSLGLAACGGGGSSAPAEGTGTATGTASDSGTGTGASCPAFALDGSDSTTFTVLTTFPFASASGIPPSTIIIFFFDDRIDPSTVTPSTFTVSAAAAPIAGAITLQLSETCDSILVFTPDSPLPASTFITVAILTSGMLDKGGNEIDFSFSMTFETGTAQSGTANAADLDFEGGALPTGVSCLGDCGVLTAFGDAPPLGTAGGYISSGDSLEAGPLVSGTDALNFTTSLMIVSGVTPSGGTLAFTYNFVSEEFDEFVDSEFDDIFLVAVTGPSGAFVRTITSVNLVGIAASTAGSFPLMVDAEETGNLVTTMDISSVGSPVTIVFAVSDVGDEILPSVVMIDNIGFQ